MKETITKAEFPYNKNPLLFPVSEHGILQEQLKTKLPSAVR